MTDTSAHGEIIPIVEPDRSPERPRAIDWAVYRDRVMSEWRALLDSDPEEPEVQAFLELHPAMVPGGSGDVGPGGHHGSEMRAVFRRPPLKGGRRDREPDFMWVTRSSGLITPILVEIEKPSKRWFTQDGRPTAKFSEAHDQLNDWRAWFAVPENQALFRDRYLFGDRYRDRGMEPWFVLIYGRHAEFEPGGGHADPGSLLFKRDGMRGSHEQLMSFDSLMPRYEHSDTMTVSMAAKGPTPFAFSPMFGTSASTTPMTATVLGDPSEALARSVMMTPRRKAYLAERWEHWRRHQRDADRAGRSFGYEMGLE